ncbi:glutathione S-transferase N-terminal domain-containing protein [Candidatus Parabeggiatoa sp. HSG14]|uniref:glutathione S-transferase N-terminal domain-containing protein n=1 Tax=Candidatus Parabeggiatoa sp. HSG14 TaxID=3055593 RepID=UPI0025A7F4EB|nr:glutathione S-transferase N-terminal domain-containing protein [Thiotrichales bacterium HSG14]
MTLYSDNHCPENHCVRWVVAEKGIYYDLQLADIQSTPPQLIKMNPYKEGITFVDREVVLYEAQIIFEYLDERFPHPPLMPVDPVSRANNRLCRYRIQRDLYNHVKVLERGSSKKAMATARRKMRENLTSLAPILAQKPFFMSDEFSLMDCYLVPLLWRLPAFGIELPRQAEPLLNYAHRLFNREAFQTCLTKIEREMRI